MIHIGIIGSGAVDSSLAPLARAAGKAVAEAGAVLICGGAGGVMEWACRGAKEAGGTTIGILPGDDRREANRYVDYAIPTGMGEARNALVVKSSDAVLAVGGGFGTLSEIAFALRAGIPTAGVRTWEIRDSSGVAAPITYFDTPEEGIRHLFDCLKNPNR